MTDDLRCEIDTLGYPKAALLGFCVACVAFNAVSVVKAAIRVAQGKKYVEEELSMYYLTLEVAEMTPGMMVAIPEENWKVFRTMSQEEFVATLVDLAQHLDPRKYSKHKRGPKRPQPKKISGKQGPSCVYRENPRNENIGKISDPYRVAHPPYHE